MMRFRIDHHVFVHNVTPDLEAIMSRFGEKIERMKQAVDAMEARITEDVAELRRQIEEGNLTVEEEHELNALIERFNRHDIIPEHPTSPPTTEEPEEPEEPGAEPVTTDPQEPPPPAPEPGDDPVPPHRAP